MYTGMYNDLNEHDFLGFAMHVGMNILGMLLTCFKPLNCLFCLKFSTELTEECEAFL